MRVSLTKTIITAKHIERYLLKNNIDVSLEKRTLYRIGVKNENN